ncbi:hypothetical protein BDV93DRAFT_541112 [Ceratobasidium sp. AG-I]|nr:hypothetical protein BDV93DRAFT_541112 [Ceratobasidium sp. AG-I]
MAGGGPSSGVSKRPQRPVLPSHLAHAHAFAAIPTPGRQAAPKSTTSYFALPTPPAPLRSFTLPSTTDSAEGTEGATTSYPTSLSSRRDGESGDLRRGCGENKARATSKPEALDQTVARRTSKADSKAQSHSQSSASVAGSSQFASAVPHSTSRSGSPFISSPGAHSARSALSIAEMDCFFVQGSRSSAYSVRSSSNSSKYQSDHSAASISDFGLSSSDGMRGDQSEIWTTDAAERERQRMERQAFMKARKEAREEVRRKNRPSKGQLPENDTEATLTQRGAVQAQNSTSPKVVPKSRHSTRGHKREEAIAPRSLLGPTASTGPPVPAESSSTQPPPSGPGPPQIRNSSSLEQSGSIDPLASDLSTNLTLSTAPSSEGAQESDNVPLKDVSIPPQDESTPTAPVLGRFNSDETEVGAATDLTPTIQDPSP